jgi:hypothetical protein
VSEVKKFQDNQKLGLMNTYQKLRAKRKEILQLQKILYEKINIYNRDKHSLVRVQDKKGFSQN